MRRYIATGLTMAIPAALFCQIPPSEKLSETDSKLFANEVRRVERMLESAGDKCSVAYALARTWASGGDYGQAMASLPSVADLNLGLDPSNSSGT